MRKFWSTGGGGFGWQRHLLPLVQGGRWWFCLEVLWPRGWAKWYQQSLAVLYNLKGELRTLPNGVTTMGWELSLAVGGKFSVGHQAVPFYRTRIPISCGGQTLSRRRIEFQLGF
jgi:hypothetical protein